jgi:hypothetical protein
VKCKNQFYKRYKLKIRNTGKLKSQTTVINKKSESYLCIVRALQPISLLNNEWDHKVLDDDHHRNNANATESRKL